MIQILSLFHIISWLSVRRSGDPAPPSSLLWQSNLECYGEPGGRLRREWAAKMAVYIGQEVLAMIFLRVFVTVLIPSTIYNPVGPDLAVKRK